MSTLFISHASADGAPARELAEKLSEWGYRSLFLDFDPEHGIRAGAEWEAELYRQLKRARALVAVVSRAFLESRWCFAEVTQARALGKPVFPVKIEPCELGSLLDDRQGVDLTLGEAEGYERLRRGLESALGVDLPFDPERPYPGFVSFEAEDAGVFFGREDEQADLIETLERMRLRGEPRMALVVGASGSGKSSLVKAGVLPRLERDFWIVVPPFRPGERPDLGLARAFAAAFEEAGTRRGWREVAELLADESAAGAAGHPWNALAEDLREAAGKPRATVLLTIDQLEEVLTASHDSVKARHAAFRSDLHAILTGSSSPLLVVATLRSDFLGRFPELTDPLPETVLVGPMREERLGRVIVGPAERVGVELEESLVRRLVADTGSSDALPLLAFTLRELWERREGDTITEDLYETQLGSIAGAVARIAEGIGDWHDSQEERALRSTFLRMVFLSDEGQFTRKPDVRWEDLPEPSRPLVERFVDEHLLVSDTDMESGERRVEVAHEALFSAWERLARWLDQERELVLFRQRLARARAEWQRLEEDPSALLEGAALTEAETWAEERHDDLDAPDLDFVERSLERRERERAEARRRRRRVVAGLAAGLAVALALASIAAWQWLRAEEQRELADMQRRQAEARQLATVASGYGTESADDLVPRLLLATESLRSAWTPEGYAAWATAVSELLPGPAERLPVSGEVTGLAAHPTEPWMAVADRGEGVRVLEIPSGREIARLEHPEGGQVLVFSPDGRWLAAGWNERISVWRTEGWGLETTLDGFGHTRDIDFTLDGEEMVAAQTEVVLGPVSTRSWRVLGPTEREDDEYALAVAFSPDDMALGIGGAETMELWLRPRADSPWEEAPRVHVSLQVVDGGYTDLKSPLKGRMQLELSYYEYSPEYSEPANFSHPRRDDVELNLPGRERRRSADIPAHYRWIFPHEDGTFSVPRRDVQMAPTESIEHFTLSPEERWLITGGRVLEVWDLDEATRTGSTRNLKSTGTRSVTFSADGLWLAACEEGEPRVRLFATDPWREAASFEAGCSALAFAADDHLVARDDQATVAHLFTREGDEWRAGSATPAMPIGAEIALSPDRRFAAVRAPYGASLRYRELTRPSRTGLVDLETGEEVAWRTNEEADVADFLREIEPFHGTLTREDLTIRWESKDGEGGSPGRPIERGADGRLDLLDRSADWPALGFERETESPDGRWSVDASGRGKLVDPKTGRELLDLGDAREATFSPDSEWLALATEDGVRLWRLGPVEALVEETCDRVPRNLTPDEWPLEGPPPITCPDRPSAASEGQ